MNKYTTNYIRKKIGSYSLLRGRINEFNKNDRLCFVFFSEEDLLNDYPLIRHKFNNCKLTVLNTNWGEIKKLSNLVGSEVIGFQTALTLVDFHLVAYTTEIKNTRKLQIICKKILFGGRPNYYIYSNKLPTDSLKPRPHFYRKNKDKIHYIVNHLADETSVNCYLSRVKSILFGVSGYTEISTYEQYRHPQVKANKGDIVIEGGVGTKPNTTMMFSKAIGENGKVFAFEPVPYMYETAVKHTKAINNIKLEKCGIWHKEGKMDITLAANVSTFRKIANFKDNPTVSCNLIPIDRYCLKNKIHPSLIKMDIEGAEQNALKGANQMILENKPKLQICLYHSLKDFIEIPVSIIDKNLNYKLYIGHHTPFMFECLMYAI